METTGEWASSGSKSAVDGRGYALRISRKVISLIIIEDQGNPIVPNGVLTFNLLKCVLV
jgi:hypothetical protein